MTLDEFLRRDDGSDRRCELVDGVPLAMAPPAEAHRPHAEILRRRGEHWIAVLVRGRGAVLRLESVDLSLPMAELYDGIELDGEGLAEQPNP